MAVKPLSEELLAYHRDVSLREDDILRHLRDETDKYPMGRIMRVMREEGEAAGVADRIEVRMGDARETLAKLLDKSGPESVDFAFIDADKVNYPTYYESTLELLRPGTLPCSALSAAPGLRCSWETAWSWSKVVSRLREPVR